MTRRASTGLCLTLALRPDTGAAHAFQAGTGIYDQFIEGAAVALTAPEIILVLLPLGLLAGLWRRDGMLAIWPFLLVGQAAGVFLAAISPDATGVAALALGVMVATLAALRPGLPSPVPQVLAALTGIAASAASFQGHGLFELPAGIHAGLLFGANLAIATLAGAASASLETWPRPWLAIAWRVVASWVAAIGLMVLSFDLRPLLA